MAIKSTFKNMVITLGLITLISGVCLSAVYELTKETIRLGEIQRVNDGIGLVVPDFSNDPYTEAFRLGADSLTFYPAKQGNELVGMAVKTYSKDGYNGDIILMVGFKPDGTIIKAIVLEHTETPGLGDLIEHKKSKFGQQFEGKNPNDFKINLKKDGGQIDGITSATISSRAFANAVALAYKAYREDYLKGEAWDGVSGATAEPAK